MKSYLKEWLSTIENRPSWSINSAARTIQQTCRNELREQGLAALKDDLQQLVGDQFDVVSTKEGIVVAVETPDFTFSWEIKCTIKGIDYDPFIEADKWDAEVADRKAKAEAVAFKKANEAKALAEKRAAKMGLTGSVFNGNELPN